MSGLKPLPDSALVAADLREMARKLILQAERLEASCGVNNYEPKRRVEFAFSPEKLANEKLGRRRK